MMISTKTSATEMIEKIMAEDHVSYDEALKLLFHLLHKLRQH